MDARVRRVKITGHSREAKGQEDPDFFRHYPINYKKVIRGYFRYLNLISQTELNLKMLAGKDSREDELSRADLVSLKYLYHQGLLIVRMQKRSTSKMTVSPSKIILLGHFYLL